MAPSLSQLGLSSLLVLSSISLSRALAIANPLPATWSYVGCYSDSVGQRTLGAAFLGSGTMTEEVCMAYCLNAGYVYAGVEYTQECYCDTKIAATGTVQAGTDCNMPCGGNAAEACGGPNRINLFHSSATISGPVTNPGVGQWHSFGCYNDSAAARTLSVGAVVLGGPANMSVLNCVNACQGLSYKYAGVEYAGQCFCDNTFQNYGAPASDYCNMACNGNTTELCGGPNRLNVYGFQAFPTTVTSSTVAPTTSKSTTSTTSRSTSTTTTSKTSSSSSSSKTSTSTTSKTSSSSSSSKTSTSTTSSSSKSSTSTSTTSKTSSSTSSTKSTSSSVTKGTTSTPSTTTTTSSAPQTTTLAAGWNSIGCYVDSVASRTLKFGTIVAGGAPLTVELCQAACRNGGYVLAGVEYSGECYCDNVFQNGITTTASDGNAQCTMPCNGNAAETCGGPNRLNVYKFGTASISVSTVPSTSTNPTTTTTSAAATTTTPVTTGLPAGWTYRGCYVDQVYGRILANQQNDNQAMTIESCVATCAGQGYTVAGMQFGIQCFCDNFIRDGGVLGPESDCNTKCGGNQNEICGGGSRDSVYAIGTLTVYGPPSNQQTYSGYTYQGCLTDGMTPRPLPYKMDRPTDNQASTCLASCAKFGYSRGGMEYGRECYCGNPEDVTASGATFVADSQCNAPCPGNATTFCGQGNLLSFYAWTANPPLNKYSYPTGNAAGAFSMLVTGPVVPLITTMGRNGKVTFVEKSGTSPTPGSTGAYELDLTTLQFRTMHLKTDVFCSAGLTLPDKVARQINVGGWSGDSTYGVRLYWPDGSPGQPSVNDWQENYQEVHLQAGRWYPTAMIMVNGSILVVGGEDGSNGAPVPSLELLPKVGGTLFMQWLQDTDPYNLYPYLAVLPSGGIFVAYYNQARILSETTFATTKTLPQIPGSVLGEASNDVSQIGGRTYPLEGTMVLLPQYAPYGDPLTVLICGGGTPFGGPALDNCVSTQPEAANPTWTIEKMPSKRVMSCMAALPDGTYLIVNGAHVGIAGFGLASDANHNALLYDPTKPVNSRISVMANTTIDRFYHSEALLLQDGRVLISGSDPETPGLIQEYRVEIFTPPYLMGNPARPSFTITNTDWGYGATITVTVALNIGGNTRFSLLGATSSTHGNSMGQRTLFPAVSCNGNSCSITSPPNGHICPPGWYMLYLLDGPTPSVAKWVRIGGDPGNLGAWPAGFADFSVPGSG